MQTHLDPTKTYEHHCTITFTITTIFTATVTDTMSITAIKNTNMAPVFPPLVYYYNYLQMELMVP